MKKLVSLVLAVVLLICSVQITYAQIGYEKSNIDIYVGERIINLNHWHQKSSSEGYYPYKKRLDSNGNLQCVGYAYARLEEKLGLSPDFNSGAGAKDIPANAPNGAERTSYTTGKKYTIKVYTNDNGSHITANSWVSFGPGNSSYGHVIYVEEVIGDTVYYTESGTSMWKKGTTGTLKKKTKYNFINYCSSGGKYVGTVVFEPKYVCNHQYMALSETCVYCGEQFQREYTTVNDYFTVVSDWIYVKTKPYSECSTSYGILYKGNTAYITRSFKNIYGNVWYEINFNGNTGYAYSGHFERKTQNNVVKVNTRVGIVSIPSSWDNLSIRTGPSTNYAIVGSMNNGARCVVYPDKTSNGWYYVEYNGIKGYAAGNRIILQ